MKLKKSIKPVWNNIYIIQDKLEKKLKSFDKTYIDNVKMVSGELLENSVKYYMSNGIKKKINFCFNNNDDLIISINNQIIKDEDYTNLSSFIEKINSSSNPYNLFISRLQEILDNRIKGESKLGLLRVASDGGFVLGCSLVKNRMTVSAVKSKNELGVVMKPLVYEDLEIDVALKEDLVIVDWIGKCRTLNPERVLDSYLIQIINIVKGKKLEVRFDKLESMNSSTVPPILTFIKTLEENGIESSFLYNDREDWQRASFKPLSVISGKYKFVKIIPLTSKEFV